MIDALIAQKVDGIIVSAERRQRPGAGRQEGDERGIKVISFDSAIAKDGRIMHLNASSTPLIGAKQVQMIAKTLDNKGEVAILSAASTMTNQNSWIAAMKEEWKKPEYKDMPLVATVYGDDQDDKSYREMQALAKAHPNLKGVISPTTIGIRSGAKAIMDDGSGRQDLHHRPRTAIRNEGRGAEGRLRHLRDLEPGRLRLLLDRDHDQILKGARPARRDRL